MVSISGWISALSIVVFWSLIKEIEQKINKRIHKKLEVTPIKDIMRKNHWDGFSTCNLAPLYGPVMRGDKVIIDGVVGLERGRIELEWGFGSAFLLRSRCLLT